MLNVGVPALVATIVTVFASIKLTQFLINRTKRTDLKGPPSNGFLIGRSLDVLRLTPNRGMIFEEWARDYGSIYRVPLVLGSSLVVICDVKALEYIHTKDTDTFILVPANTRVHKAMFGPFTISPEGDEHKRWRRNLQPSFTTTAIRSVTSAFYDSAYKLKTHWDTYFESATEVTIDVQNWVSKMTLGAMGVAAFGHDFKALDDCDFSVMKVFEEFNRQEDDLLSRLTVFIGAVFPIFMKFPTKRAKLIAKYNKAVSITAREIISNELEKRELSSTGLDVKERSLINMIMKGTYAGDEMEARLVEMITHIVCRFYLPNYQATNIQTLCYIVNIQNLFFVAGYETTSITITWALIELARHPDMQEKLREELQKFSDCDPDWDQLKTELRYLDAVVHETLRLHPPAETLMRSAAQDDILPLSNPVRSASGEVIDSFTVQKGTMVILPYVFFNTSEEFWGPDAKQFIPERWFKEVTSPAKDFHGYRHLYTFSGGPRMCLGRDFAMTEFKATLSVLIRNFTFELEDGPGTEFAFHRAFLPRPKPVGKVGAVAPMRVRQVAK